MATISLPSPQTDLVYVGVKFRGGQTNYVLGGDGHNTKCKRNYKDIFMCSAILQVRTDLLAMCSLFVCLFVCFK